MWKWKQKPRQSNDTEDSNKSRTFDYLNNYDDDNLYTTKNYYHYDVTSSPRTENNLHKLGSFCRTVSHFRNIRAVIFHPAGDYVFAAAPDSPRLPSETLTPCRLYAFSFSSIFSDTNFENEFELSSIADIIPQV